MNKRRNNGQQKISRFYALPTAVLAMIFAASGSAQGRPAITVWKDPGCGCCNAWTSHMQRAGFEVKTHDTGNTAVRERLGVPQKYGSCHTAQIGSYAIEGHVPAADIRRLLREARPAAGLAAPGMPVGSPGMDGPAYSGRKDAYDVMLIGTDRNVMVYQSYR
jgi:hypothetical protein